MRPFFKKHLIRSREPELARSVHGHFFKASRTFDGETEGAALWNNGGNNKRICQRRLISLNIAKPNSTLLN